MFKKTFIAVVIFAATAFYPAVSNGAVAGPAAYLSLVPTVAAGDRSSLTVKVIINSSQPVNAYDLTIAYPQNDLQFKNISAVNSIIDVWQSDFAQSDSGAIVIRGGSLRPWSGGQGLLATINFRFRDLLPARLDFTASSKVFAADGQGTPLPVAAGSVIVSSANLPKVQYLAYPPGATSTAAAAGNSPPENYFQIAADPFNPDADLFIFSNLNDLDPKAVLVSTRHWFLSSPWQIARNPYPISKDTWSINVKVMDQAGMVHDYVIYRPLMVIQETMELVGTAVLAGLLAYVLIKIKRRRKGA